MNVHYRYDDMSQASIEELQRYVKLLSEITVEAFGTTFEAILGCDIGRRFWLQLSFVVNHTSHRGRKWILSRYMLDDEIVKTVWLAFEVAVKHELLEGFRFGGELVFNPHTPFTKFVEASRTEVFRLEPEGT